MVDSSSDTQNESEANRHSRAINDSKTYLSREVGVAATALESGSDITSPAKARSTWSETETDKVEEVKTPADSESSANENAHQTMLSAVNDLLDDHYGVVRDGPFTPHHPLVIKRQQKRTKPPFQKTPKHNRATSNSMKEQTEKKWSPIKYPQDGPKTIVIAEPMIQKKTIGDRLGPPLAPKRIHDRLIIPWSKHYPSDDETGKPPTGLEKPPPQ